MVANRKVEVGVPSVEQERPRYGHIGLIVAVCFVVGAAWPFIVGVRLVPSVPGDDDKSEATPAAGGSAALPVAEGNVLKRSSEPTVEIEKSSVIACQDAKGRKPRACDKPNLEELVTPRLKALVACEGAQTADGALSLGLKLDFKKNRIVEVVKGKSSTLPKETLAPLLACAKQELEALPLTGVGHEAESYLVFFFLKFVPPGSLISPDNAATQTIVPASGSATVVFESAMVRNAAGEEGDVVTRLLYGTRVVVTGRAGDWYEIKYDSHGRKGFIHKNAIGM